MTHGHYGMLRGQRLGFNPSPKSHNLLSGRSILYYCKSKGEIGGGKTGWNSRQAATTILPSLVVTSKTVNFTPAALQLIPSPEMLFKLFSFSPQLHFVCAPLSLTPSMDSCLALLYCSFPHKLHTALLFAQNIPTRAAVLPPSFQTPIRFKSHSQCQPFTDACSLTHPHTPPAFTS